MEKVYPFPSLVRQAGWHAGEDPADRADRHLAEAEAQGRAALAGLVAALTDVAAQARRIAALRALPPGPREVARQIADRAAADLLALEALKSRT